MMWNPWKNVESVHRFSFLSIFEKNDLYTNIFYINILEIVFLIL